MGNALPNIDYKKKKTNPTVNSNDSDYLIPFYKGEDYFVVLQNFTDFVKAVEGLVRKHPDYKRYIAYLREEVGLTRCQVLSNIDTEDADIVDTQIEMHHGPILTLFDLASIITDWAIYNNVNITTFSIAERLIQEHFDNTIQVVMLSTTVHEQVHEGNIFISTKQAFGDLATFLEKYMDGLSLRHIDKINKYLVKSLENDSYHNGCLLIDEQVRNWNTLNKEW